MMALELRSISDHINLPDMIGSFASGASAFLVAKKIIRKYIALL